MWRWKHAGETRWGNTLGKHAGIPGHSSKFTIEYVVRAAAVAQVVVGVKIGVEVLHTQWRGMTMETFKTTTDAPPNAL